MKRLTYLCILLTPLSAAANNDRHAVGIHATYYLLPEGRLVGVSISKSISKDSTLEAEYSIGSDRIKNNSTISNTSFLTCISLGHTINLTIGYYYKKFVDKVESSGSEVINAHFGDIVTVIHGVQSSIRSNFDFNKIWVAIDWVGVQHPVKRRSGYKKRYSIFEHDQDEPERDYRDSYEIFTPRVSLNLLF